MLIDAHTMDTFSVKLSLLHIAFTKPYKEHRTHHDHATPEEHNVVYREQKHIDMLDLHITSLLVATASRTIFPEYDSLIPSSLCEEQRAAIIFSQYIPEYAARNDQLDADKTIICIIHHVSRHDQVETDITIPNLIHLSSLLRTSEDSLIRSSLGRNRGMLLISHDLHHFTCTLYIPVITQEWIIPFLQKQK